jgi:L-ascorbate metabolism protein UlaG (beta-lactamase superfamily)
MKPTLTRAPDRENEAVRNPLEPSSVMRVPGHLSSFGRFLAHRERREWEDEVALASLAGSPLPLPDELGLQWLGVAGYRLSHEGHALYIDPYVSRAPLRSLLAGRPTLPDPELHDRLLGSEPDRVAGILVGHTHFDHAVDVPLLARRWDVRAYGSSSLRKLMALHGMADRALEVEPGREYEIGPFEVTFFPSLHSKLLLGFAVPFDGELSCESLDALSPSAYRCGDVFGIRIKVAGTTFYHQGSANLIDDEVPRAGVDVFLAGIAGRSFTPDYWSRILPRLEPRIVVANHFDDFFRPAAAPLRFSPNVNLAAVPEEVEAVSRDFAVCAMSPEFPGLESR